MPSEYERSAEAFARWRAVWEAAHGRDMTPTENNAAWAAWKAPARIPAPAPPDAVTEAREAFPAGSRVRVIGRHPQDGHDFTGRVGVVSENQDHPTGEALWVWFADGYDRATRVSCPVAYLAAEQAEKENQS